MTNPKHQDSIKLSSVLGNRVKAKPSQCTRKTTQSSNIFSSCVIDYNYLDFVMKLLNNVACSLLLPDTANSSLNGRVRVAAVCLLHVLKQWSCVTADDDDDDGLWVNPGKRLPLAIERDFGTDSLMPGATAPRRAVTRPAGGPAAEAWKVIYMSGGREIVTLRSALYGADWETLSPLLWGNREARRPSPIYPPFRPPSITASPALGVAGDAGGCFPPSCLGLKAGLHPRQLASRVDTKEANDCARSHHADSVSVPVSDNVLVFGLREDAGVPGEKLHKNMQSHVNSQHAEGPCCCEATLLPSAPRRHPEETRTGKQQKHKT